ncbi:MAG: glutamate racemase [Eubacteriales bacterium]|jgi:glutamate racemase|nr:glutamate racemase [Eubacteriales bacterium]
MDLRPIGIFDSGLGGLTVVKSVFDILPGESIVYFGDTGRVPYGTRSRETIIKYSAQDVNFLLTKDVKGIIIACGTASSVALEHVKGQTDVPIIGVVKATARAAALATKNKKVAVIGTSGTINSGSYEREIKKADPDIKVFPKACPLFVPLVENGYAKSEAAHLVAKDYLLPLKNEGVDTIILGCTHYPLLKDIISDIMGDDTVLVDSGGPVALEFKKMLMQKDMLNFGGGKPTHEYYVSDDVESFSYLGSLFLESEILHQVKRIDIDKY